MCFSRNASILYSTVMHIAQGDRHPTQNTKQGMVQDVRPPDASMSVCLSACSPLFSRDLRTAPSGRRAGRGGHCGGKVSDRRSAEPVYFGASLLIYRWSYLPNQRLPGPRPASMTWRADPRSCPNLSHPAQGTDVQPTASLINGRVYQTQTHSPASVISWRHRLPASILYSDLRVFAGAVTHTT